MFSEDRDKNRREFDIQEPIKYNLIDSPPTTSRSPNELTDSKL